MAGGGQSGMSGGSAPYTAPTGGGGMLGQNTTNMGTPNFNQMVTQAYGGIGRAGFGTGDNQIDQPGFNYWTNALQSGALNPADFQSTFSRAASTPPEGFDATKNPALAATYANNAQIAQNQALSQVSGARPAPGAPQYYQPVYQPQYQNFGVMNPMGVSQYGQMGGFNPYMMYTPFNQYAGGPQSPFDYAAMQPSPAQTMPGASQPILTKSTQRGGRGGRGGFGGMRMASGGIAALLDK